MGGTVCHKTGGFSFAVSTEASSSLWSEFLSLTPCDVGPILKDEHGEPLDCFSDWGPRVRKSKPISKTYFFSSQIKALPFQGWKEASVVNFLPRDVVNFLPTTYWVSSVNSVKLRLSVRLYFRHIRGISSRLASRRGSPWHWDHAWRASELQPKHCLCPRCSSTGMSHDASWLMSADVSARQGCVLTFFLCTKARKGLANWKESVKIILISVAF